MEIGQIICYVGYIVFLSCMLLDFVALNLIALPLAVDTGRVFNNALCGFRLAIQFIEFLAMIGMSGKNFRSIGPQEVLDLASTIFNEERNLMGNKTKT